MNRLENVKNREWIRNTILHQDMRRTPYNFMFSPPARCALEHYFNTQDIESTLDFPIRMTAPVSIKPLYADPNQYGNTLKDEFGVIWTTSEIDRGSPIAQCIKEPELSGYNFPRADEEYRYEGLKEWCEENSEHYTIIWVGDIWERATFMRGMENILLDVALNPGFVHELLEGITKYILETMHILFGRFYFDGIAVSDDYGTQHGMIISPADWRKLIKPCLYKIYSYAKKHDRSVFHHSCGNITPIIQDMIEIGLDILHPIQPEVMNIFEFKREFGRDITFCGGLGTQQLLPYGTPEQIRHEVRRLKEHMGMGGGYILEPGITIQADVPIENMVAMIDEAMKAN
ncbi:MAG: hypothetical protein AMS17_15665 [Spirochaetes bacterium DG_61]|nr:MAG: hypothetical protein AMS17_15665 [Spirochaetes bacterium DG_61]